MWLNALRLLWKWLIGVAAALQQQVRGAAARWMDSLSTVRGDSADSNGCALHKYWDVGAASIIETLSLQHRNAPWRGASGAERWQAPCGGGDADGSRLEVADGDDGDGGGVRSPFTHHHSAHFPFQEPE